MSLLTTVKETVLGGDEVAADRPSDRPVAAESTTPVSADGCASEADFVVETGRSRADALLDLVEARGGRVKQSALVELTGWSKATVSRHLADLEAEGAVDRVPVGRHKVVLLPDESLLDDGVDPDDLRE